MTSFKILACTVALGAAGSTLAAALPARAGTIVDDWANVATPAPPAIRDVAVDPRTTALLLLDFVRQTCGGPHCTAAVPKVQKLLQAARAAKMLVVYSYTKTSKITDTLPPLAPLVTEPTVQSGPDKFLATDLQTILAGKAIRTVIVAGTSAQGAVLYTASHAALGGFNVVVPIDGMPSEVPYAEQFVVWNLANAPQVSLAVRLTTIDRLTL